MLLTGEASHTRAKCFSLPLVSCGCQAPEWKDPAPQKDPKLSGESLWGAEQS